MNYYILPNNYAEISVSIKKQLTNYEPCISFSVFFQLENIKKQLSQLYDLNADIELKQIMTRIVNPLEFVYTNVPGTNISVSKVKPDSNIFFELMEIFYTLNINDLIKRIYVSCENDLSGEVCTNKNRVSVAHLTHNYSSTTYLLNMFREENGDNVIVNEFSNVNPSNLSIMGIDVFIVEFKPEDYDNVADYSKNMLIALYTILKCQIKNGISIIKLDSIYYKPIVEIVYVLSTLYEKVCIIKPFASDYTNGGRFLVCKGFVGDGKLAAKLEGKLTTYDSSPIGSILEGEIPCYFLSKLEEINAIIGQQQLDTLSQITNILISKNKEDKIENLKRCNIQKSVQWCEKNQLPHNKFADKINVF
jgi:hypothetical protein